MGRRTTTQFKPCTFRGCSWFGDVTSPVEELNGNVTFPRSWGHWRAAIWRFWNDCPGANWDRERGFYVSGIPTPERDMMAAFLNWWFGRPTPPAREEE